MPRKPSACVRKSDACVRRHRHVHTARVSETYERQVFCNKVEDWNESHIVWELFQTHIFSLYKAIHAHIQNTENPKGKPKIH